MTPPPQPFERPIGNDLIINEVFTLPPDRYYAYSWLELYNPTDHVIPWFDDTYPASINAVGSGGTFILTQNDGEEWSTPPSVPAFDFNGVDFPYPDTGYVVGDNGLVYRMVRVDGEYQFFTPAGIPTTENLNSISSAPLTVSAYAAGNRGTIIRTITRGQTWVAQNSGTTKNIRCIKMASVAKVFVCGDSGLVMKSASAGTWLKVTIPEQYQQNAYYTIGTSGLLGDTVWVGGENGVMLLSKNMNTSSPTWFPETTNTSATLRGSYFRPGTQQAWAVGDSGTIIYKKETGKSWVKQSSGVTATLRSVTFVDGVRGWAVGDGGVIIHTTNGGTTWSRLQSGTTADLRSIYALPLNIRVLNRYVVQIYGQRKQFFFDPITRTINYDYIVKQDTGWLYYDPEILRQQGVGTPPADVPANGFVIINSDSLRFQEHTKIGPGKTNILNFSIGFYYDSTAFGGARPVLWDLLQAGELRLIKQYFKIRLGTNEFLGLTTETVDVVRWGGFKPTLDQLPHDLIYPDPGPELIYPQNAPAGIIPEWWSLARYGDDVGTSVDQQNTAGSFYMAERPVPGYYSQLKKPK